MTSSPLQDFLSISADYMKVVGKLRLKAQFDAEAMADVEALDTFYESVQGIITRVELEKHEINLSSVFHKTIAHRLEWELKNSYNLIYKSGHTDLFQKLAALTVIEKKQPAQNG